METLEAVGLAVVILVCTCSMLAPLLLAVIAGSFPEQGSATDRADREDSDGE